MSNDPRAPFHGRQRELRLLAEEYAKRGASLVPVYGRRRVGKSELLRRFCADKPTVFFEAARHASTPQQVQGLLAAAAIGLDRPRLAEAHGIADWRTALREVTAAAPEKSRPVLVLDELQWAAEADPTLPSVLKQLWDTEWQRRGQWMVILCGSYLGFMEREILGARAALHGRRTAQLMLAPLDHLEAAAFFPGWSTEERARAYFLCGGIPYHLQLLADCASVTDGIIRLFLAFEAVLQREPDFLLRDELRNLPAYGAILHALAHGAHRPTDIARATGASTAELDHYLKTLVQLRYLARQTPLSPQAPNRRAVRYVVADSLLRFHFRFLTRAAPAAALADPAHLYAAFVAPDIDAYWGLCFEDLCREATARLLIAERVALPHAVGRFWSPTAEFDVVALRGDHRIDLGECKWGPAGRAATWAKSLRERSSRFPSGSYSLGYRLFTRTALRSVPAGVTAHSLASLYG